MALTIRRMRDDDKRGVEAIETVFQTDRIFDVVVSPRKLELVERVLETPLTKRYPIADAFAPWSSWDTAWVADDDGVVGFASVEYEAWHRRLVLWHLYVSPPHRQRGIARALLAEVERHAKQKRALTVWLETSNVNVPGIAAYERLGYSLCGADVTLYDDLPYAKERALYLSKRL
jgi:ribosomal protein S18 acetylase RimI-like enzyme